MWARITFVVALLVLLMGCKVRFSEPPRPSGVPKESLWVGGADGGVFVQIREVTKSNSMYRMVVYHGRTGEILFRGLAELRPAGKGRLNIDDPGSYSGWDGEKMILSDERTLEPIKPEHR
jgi:hypothetical protein